MELPPHESYKALQIEILDFRKKILFYKIVSTRFSFNIFVLRNLTDTKESSSKKLTMNFDKM